MFWLVEQETIMQPRNGKITGHCKRSLSTPGSHWKVCTVASCGERQVLRRNAAATSAKQTHRWHAKEQPRPSCRYPYCRADVSRFHENIPCRGAGDAHNTRMCCPAGPSTQASRCHNGELASGFSRDGSHATNRRPLLPTVYNGGGTAPSARLRHSLRDGDEEGAHARKGTLRMHRCTTTGPASCGRLFGS